MFPETAGSGGRSVDVTPDLENATAKLAASQRPLASSIPPGIATWRLTTSETRRAPANGPNSFPIFSGLAG